MPLAYVRGLNLHIIPSALTSQHCTRAISSFAQTALLQLHPGESLQSVLVNAEHPLQAAPGVAGLSWML